MMGDIKINCEKIKICENFIKLISIHIFFISLIKFLSIFYNKWLFVKEFFFTVLFSNTNSELQTFSLNALS